MKTNLDQLEQRQREYQSLKNFVDKIETQVRQLPKIAFEQSVKPQPIKAITNEEYSLKLNLKAQMIREFVPPEFKPDKQQSISKAQVDFKAEKTSDISSTKYTKPLIETPSSKAISPPADRPVSFNIKSALDKTVPEKISQPLTVSFQTKVVVPAQPQKAETKPPEWKQPMPARIAAIEKAIQERQGKSVTVSDIRAPKTTIELSERKNWFTPATDKTQPLQKVIDKAYAEHKKLEEKPASTIREQFKKPEPPSQPAPKTTNEIEIEKVKQEAQEARTRVPPQYRATPYEKPKKNEEKTEPEKTAHPFKTEFTAQAENNPPSVEETPHEIKQPETPEETSRPRMSQNFNAASFNGVEPPEPETPEEDFNEDASPDAERN